jgi:hypothetical protein
MNRSSAIALCLLCSCGDGATGSPPEVILEAPSFCDLGAQITLDGSRTTDPDNDVVRFLFIIADGSAVKEIAGPQTTHTCQVEGLIEATLVVLDGAGNQGTASQVISVRPP